MSDAEAATVKATCVHYYLRYTFSSPGVPAQAELRSGPNRETALWTGAGYAEADRRSLQVKGGLPRAKREAADWLAEHGVPAEASDWKAVGDSGSEWMITGGPLTDIPQ